MPQPPDPIPRTLLIIEDDEIFRSRLARAFAARGFEVREVETGERALQLARADTPEFVVVDLRMPGMGGVEVVRELHRLDPTTVIVVLTGYGSIATAVDAIRAGATDYLTKPANVDEVVAAFGLAAHGSAPADANPRVPTLACVEWEHINRVLTECSGNISKAAKVLGIHRRSLQRKLGKVPLMR